MYVSRLKAYKRTYLRRDDVSTVKPKRGSRAFSAIRTFFSRGVPIKPPSSVDSCKERYIKNGKKSTHRNNSKYCVLVGVSCRPALQEEF